jgi:hypothetical protein
MEWQKRVEDRYLRIGSKKNLPLMLLALALAIGLGALSFVAWQAVYGPGNLRTAGEYESALETSNMTFGDNTPITEENFPLVFGALLSLGLFAFLLAFLGLGQMEELYDQGDKILVIKTFYGLKSRTPLQKESLKLKWNTDIWRYSQNTIPGLFSLGPGLLLLESEKKTIPLGKGLKKNEEAPFRQRMAELFPVEARDDS